MQRLEERFRRTRPRDAVRADPGQCFPSLLVLQLAQCIYELSGEGGLACRKAQGTRSSVKHVAYPKIHLAGLEQAVSWSLVVLEMSLCCADTWLELGVCWY